MKESAGLELSPSNTCVGQRVNISSLVPQRPVSHRSVFELSCMEATMEWDERERERERFYYRLIGHI